jgi:osmotically-inducible protein OsmY/uncharacterized protein YjbJ (UPF0337 family)
MSKKLNYNDSKSLSDAQWKQIKGRVREQWGKLTDDDVERTKGHFERLVGLIGERYDDTREAVHAKVEEMLSEVGSHKSDTVVRSIAIIGTALALAAGTPLPAHAGDASQNSQLAEATLHAKVRIALLTDLHHSGLGIDIDVHGDDVSLTGEVNERSTRELASTVVADIEGVDEVDNQLRVDAEAYDARTPAGQAAEEAQREVSDGLLATRVKAQLLGELGLEAMGIEVSAADGHVVLTGSVDSDEHATIAEREARRTSGVEQVKSRLETDAS